MTRRVIAHRGHKVGAPEQTAVAFELAIDLGASMLETDLRFTRDGVPVMLHDARLERTTNGRGPVVEMDWSDLSGLDAGSWFGARFAGARVPRLDDMFDLAARRNIALCIEAKGEGVDNADTALFAAREIARRGRLDVDVVASFDHAALAAAVAAVPGLRTAPDRLPEHGPSTAAQLIAQARAARASIIQHHFADLDRDVVSETQAAGIEVWAWPPGTIEEAQFAYESGAVGLMGDDVAAIAAVLKRSGD
ncbi:MAG TPA: glycerophosphodiester phosphodiesterase family protein [Devosia sp.]|nr:glycerophosphodiester phosphodiesterase family protein [Devosia sp.]